MRQAFRGANPFGIAKLDALRFDEPKKALTVAADIALHFGQCREFFALGLRDVLSRDLRPSLCALDVCRE